MMPDHPSVFSLNHLLLLHFFIHFLIRLLHTLTKADHKNLFYIGIFLQALPDGIYSYLRCLFQRISVNTCADRRKCQGSASIFMCQTDTVFITIFQQFRLPEGTPVPDWSRCMDHIFCWQLIPFCYFCLTRLTPSQSPALFQKPGACCPVNRPVHTASSQKRTICGICNGIHMIRCDVTHLNLKSSHN